MKPSACLTVEFLAGTTIDRAISEARELARTLRLAYVNFDFNGVSVSVRGGGDDQALIKDFHAAISEKVKTAKYAIG